MRSSISVTKFFAFYFILLHLFLRAKMCVGTVHGASSGNINDSDESFFPVETHTTVAPPLLDSLPSPVDRSVAKIHRRQHAAVSTPKPTTTAALHHVRHEHSHVKNRHIVRQPPDHLRSQRSNFKSAEAGRNWQRPHHHRGLHQQHQDFNPSSSFALSANSAQRSRLNRSNSRSTSSASSQQKSNINPWISNQRRPFSTLTAEPISSSAKKHRNSGDSKKFNHHTKNYFEELLNSYKSHSPYFKDHLQRDTGMLTKSLQTLNTKCNDKKCKSRHAKEETNDDDYDYEYEEDEDDDEDDYDDEYYDAEAQGDAGYSTTTNSVTVAESTKKIQEQDYTNVNNKFDNSLHLDNDDAVNTKDSLSNSIEVIRENRNIQSKEVYATDANMAKSHVAKLRREGNCHLPKPKVVLASNDPTKQYTPHCTILHRCGDDVGCCPQAKTCAASKNSTVELYFFVKAVGSKSTIERLSFINHTECACINRHESISRRTLSASIVAVTSTKPPICNCPTYFQRVVDNDNRCFCDCSSSDSQCDQFKRGLEHFSMDNRRCIMNNRCEEPRCEYGRYIIAKGKCPAKKDALSIAYKG